MPSIKNKLAQFDPSTLPSVAEVTVEKIILTPEIAAEFMTHNIGNRNLRKNAINRYSRDMSAGDWLFTGETIKFDWDGRLVDGQHRCQTAIDTGESFWAVVVRGLDPKVQSVLDTNARRSAEDALRFAGITRNASQCAGAARIAKGVESGVIKTAISGHAPVTMTNTEVLEWVQGHREIMDAAPLALKVAKSVGGAPAALTYCIWRLEQVDALEAIEFFESIVEARTTGAGDPRLVLIRKFKQLKENRTHLTAGIQLYYVFKAWEIWRSSEWRDGKKRSSDFRATTADGKTGFAIPFPKN